MSVHCSGYYVQVTLSYVLGDTSPIIRPDDGRSISRNVASLNILFHDVINSLFVVAGIHSTAKLANLKPNKVFFYNLADTLCSFEEPLQVKYLKHHAFISMCYIFTWFNPQINRSTILLGTHRLLSD